MRSAVRAAAALGGWVWFHKPTHSSPLLPVLMSSFSFISFSFWFSFVFVSVCCCLHSGSSSGTRGLRAVQLLAFLRYSWTWVFESRAVVFALSAFLFDFILRGLDQPARSHGVCGTSIDVAVRVDFVALVCVVACVLARLAFIFFFFDGCGSCSRPCWSLRVRRPMSTSTCLRLISA